MLFSLDQINKTDTYRLLTSSVIPRPIAWVLTENTNGSFNIAPFSYFNVVYSAPAILMFSVGHKRDGSKKDTWENIAARRRCVVHIPDQAHIEDVNESARSLPAGESELASLSLNLVEEADFSLPRIDSAPVAFDCELHQLHEIGEGPQAVIYVEVKQAYIRDDLFDSDNHCIDSKLLNPLARLGGEDYSILGKIASLPRPQ